MIKYGVIYGDNSSHWSGSEIDIFNQLNGQRNRRIFFPSNCTRRSSTCSPTGNRWKLWRIELLAIEGSWWNLNPDTIQKYVNFAWARFYFLFVTLLQFCLRSILGTVSIFVLTTHLLLTRWLGSTILVHTRTHRHVFPTKYHLQPLPYLSYPNLKLFFEPSTFPQFYPQHHQTPP